MKWVRPIISVAMAGGIIYGFVVSKITPTDFLVTAAEAVAWWYTSRDKQKITSPPPTSTPTTTTTPSTTTSSTSDKV